MQGGFGGANVTVREWIQDGNGSVVGTLVVGRPFIVRRSLYEMQWWAQAMRSSSVRAVRADVAAREGVHGVPRQTPTDRE